MKKGCIIFAHDGDIDYGSQAVLSATLVDKHLNVPVSLITDSETLTSIKLNFNSLPFDQIIITDVPARTNKRLIASGVDDVKTAKEFINSNRSLVWDLTPYDRTLVIDSDFLVFSESLSKYWDDTFEFMITPGMLDLQSKVNPKEYDVSPASIDLLWATNIMFSKTPFTKMLFELVDYIKDNYLYYAALYEFDPAQYRNDYAFSIACHILSAGCEPVYGELPIPLFFKDTDQLADINANRLAFLCKDYSQTGNYLLVNAQQQDVHIMNKQTILSNLTKLMELANV